MPARGRWVGIVLASLLALGCEGGVNLAVIDVQILDAEGRNPLASTDGTITVSVRQAGQLVDCANGACMTEVQNGEYELVLPIATFEGRTEIQVELRSEDGAEWLGASPTFVPFGEGVDAVGGMRLLVGPSGQCQRLTLAGVATSEPPRIGPARARPAAVRRRNLVLLAGGEDRAGADADDVDRFDQLLIDANDLTSWDRSTDIGPARGVELSEDVSLVVGNRSVRFIRDSLGPPVGREVSLEGASYQSAVVHLGASGAAVIAGVSSRTIHWVDSDGLPVGATELAAARTAPAAALMSGGLLVVGGHDGTDPPAEWVRALRAGTALTSTGLELPVARGGVLFPSPDGRSALWIGAEVAGTVTDATYVIRGCPEACSVEEGPRWTRARSGTAATVTAAGTLWLVGGQRGPELRADVDLVRWVGGEARIDEGPALAQPRSDATAFEHASGVVTVVGGRGDVGLRDTFELCFPETLVPL